MTPARAFALYHWIGIVGVVVVVGSATLIVFNPGMAGPYFSVLSGLCSVYISVVATRAITKTRRADETQTDTEL
jgi:hypothetical protein